jgi:hypothetical protein
LKAKGLLSYMLSLPDDWDYSVRGLVACLKEGKDGIQAALHELEKYGYLQRGQGRTDTGKLDKAVYTITELPLTENPHTEKPPAEKPPQLNTKGISTNKRSTNNTPHTPQGAGEKVDAQSLRFAQFWMAYPKKVGKGAAVKAFTKLKPSADLLSKMLEAIEKQKRSDQWQRDKGQYIPNPSTWLNQTRWEDELGEVGQETKPASQMSKEEYLRMIMERNRQDEERREKELA